MGKMPQSRGSSTLKTSDMSPRADTGILVPNPRMAHLHTNVVADCDGHQHWPTDGSIRNRRGTRNLTGDQAPFPLIDIIPTIQNLQKPVHAANLDCVQPVQEAPGQHRRGAHDEGRTHAPWQAGPVKRCHGRSMGGIVAGPVVHGGDCAQCRRRAMGQQTSGGVRQAGHAWTVSAQAIKLEGRRVAKVDPASLGQIEPRRQLGTGPAGKRATKRGKRGPQLGKTAAWSISRSEFGQSYDDRPRPKFLCQKVPQLLN